MTPPVIAYAGLTHLGLNHAAASAERGFETICFDPDEARVAALAGGVLPVSEPGLSELIERNRGRLHFTSRRADLARADVAYIAADVPTDDAGIADLGPIHMLAAEAIASLGKDALLVVMSQVPPGFTRAMHWPKRRLFYQVETLIFGRAVERATRPERFIVGMEKPEASLPPSLRAFLDAFGCPVLPMRYESAELAKISINLCLVGSIGIANTLAELCEKIGADWSEIAPALRLDARIGPHAYLSPGLGIAGGNLERDLASVCRLADEHGTDAGIVRAALANSARRRDWVFRELHRAVLTQVPNPVIAVLGLAYKEGTHSTKNSAAVALVKALTPFRVRCFDPIVSADVVAFHPRVAAASSALDACMGATALAIMTPWQVFRALDPSAVARALAGRLVVDPYGAMDATACRAVGLRHRRLGAQLEA